MQSLQVRTCAAALLLGLCCVSAQAAVITRQIMVGNFADLPNGISSTDLINGFGVNTDGTPLNQGINESAIAPWTQGVIDVTPGQEVVSWLMGGTTGDCLNLVEFLASDGFLPGLPPSCPQGGMANLVDGLAGTACQSVLRDFGRASLVVRYGFTAPTDIGYIRVIAGNFNNRDGRVFQNYDVYYRQGDCGDGTCPAHGDFQSGLVGFDEFVPLALGVKAGEFLTVNSNIWQGSATEVLDFDSKILIAGCTDLRFVFYCVADVDSVFLDQWQGNAIEDAAYQSLCPDVEADDADGKRKAYVAPVIKEIDVFSPDDHFDYVRGDIDYDGDRDLVDFAAYQDCFGGDINANGCFRFDYNDDTMIDAGDLPGFAADQTNP